MQNILKSKKDKDIISNIKNKRQFAMRMAKLYNSLCNPCKLSVVKHTKRGHKFNYNVLCDACKKKAEKICEGLL